MNQVSTTISLAAVDLLFISIGSDIPCSSGFNSDRHMEEIGTKETARQTAPQESASQSAEPPGRDKLAETMLEFPLWIESSRGLLLCQAFKPRYDWYIPALANKAELTREFLGTRTATDPDEPTMEHLI
jgi:hypothetical protein